MSNTTALTIAGNTQTALLPRRSVDYQAWLIAETRHLATVLGQEKALDKEGLRLSGMAKALADTHQDVMTRAFERAQAECTFLPVPKEMLGFYTQELKKDFEAGQAKSQAEAAAQERQLKADAAAHPENYTSIPQLLQERGGADAIVGESRNRLRERLTPRVTIAEPKVHECPHCGGQLPEGIADLRGMSPTALRSIADRIDHKAAEIAAVRAAQVQQRPSAEPATHPRRRRDDAPQP